MLQTSEKISEKNTRAIDKGIGREFTKESKMNTISKEEH